MIATHGGGKLVAASPGKGVSSPHAKGVAQGASLNTNIGATLAQTVQSPGTPRVVNPALITNPSGQQVLTAGAKPIAFSLIQSQGGTKLVESVVSGQSQGKGPFHNLNMNVDCSILILG